MAAVHGWPWLRVSLGDGRMALEGELDLGTSSWLPGADEVVAALGGRALEVDVDGLTFVDVGGLRHLHAFEDRVRLAGVGVSRRGRSPHLDDLERLLLLASEPGRRASDRTCPTFRAR